MRDSYVGDVTSLLSIDKLDARYLPRQTLLVGIGSSVLWYDPFFVAAVSYTHLTLPTILRV